MTKIDPDKIRVILATDCGSTTTKAILIQKVDGVYRQTHRGEAPTTVEEPFADVTIGVVNSITEIQELAGRRLIDDQGQIIRPATENEGCDIYISTSSAGGGLQMMVAGVVREMTAESAKRAALGAGAIVMDVIASNDKRRPHEQIKRIRELRPDIMLISGGIDGGTVLMPDLEGWKFHTCVLHELGHAMGLHHDYAGTVMCRSAGCSAHDITESDIIQWRSYR